MRRDDAIYEVEARLDLSAEESVELSSLRQWWLLGCEEREARGEVLSLEDARSRGAILASLADEGSTVAVARREATRRTTELLEKRAKTPLMARERIELRKLIANEVLRLRALDAEQGLTPAAAAALAFFKREQKRDDDRKAALANDKATSQRYDRQYLGAANGDARDQNLRL